MFICLDKKNQQIKDYIHYDYFSRDRINVTTPYRDNQPFIASHNGLFIFNVSGQVTLEDRITDQETVYSIIENKSNKCWWIGTSNNLLKMEVSNDPLQVSAAFPTYPSSQGTIRSLLLDDDQNLRSFTGEEALCYINNEQRIYEPNINY